jgi:hypothetical protein
VNFPWFLGAHASRVPPTASRRWHRHPIPYLEPRSLRRDAANHTPEACAPPFSLSVNQNNNKILKP